MKIKRVNEKKEINIESLFYFLNEIKPYSKDNPRKDIEFLKSLNLTNEQYLKLEEIITEYARERYDDGRQDGLDQCQDY